ncbi:MAG TPA: hypothetical protein VHK89_10025 [Actinomycetota bacterium]|nr:hypothetical protein [Actinomycetota bacterium]
MWLFPVGAAAVSGAFTIMLLARFGRARRPHVLAWAIALAMFAAASSAAAIGILAGWTPAWFRVYYLFGAIANVPVLASGTIYLLGPRAIAHGAAVLVGIACALAAVGVGVADVDRAGLRTDGIPRGSEVVSPAVRTTARVYSFAGFFVVAGGAAWSAARQMRSRQQHLRKLALANGLIAAGTVVVALGSGFAFYGRGLPFAVGLFVGVCLMFWGFLHARPPASAPG